MMTILDKIIAKKKLEIADRKANVPVGVLENRPLFKNETHSFKDHLLNKRKTGIIAEYKRKSPSRGVINGHSSVDEVTADYANFGASAISVLTDETFFGGSLHDLEKARIHEIPLLRKDFMIDEYQIVESKAFGADIILLIAACLTVKDVIVLAKTAKNLGLNVLLEIHCEAELEHIISDVDVVGVNNRNLNNFQVDINHSIELGNKIPADKMKIAESGITDINTIRHLQQYGFKGFLMGERFMKEKNPGLAFKEFADELLMK